MILDRKALAVQLALALEEPVRMWAMTGGGDELEYLGANGRMYTVNSRDKTIMRNFGYTEASMESFVKRGSWEEIS